MKKVNKILLGTALPFLGLSVAVPAIVTSCSVQAATIVESKWKDLNAENSNQGLSLNDKKDELTFDFYLDKSITEGDPIATLNIVKSVILEKDGSNKIANVVTEGIVDYNTFQSITLESVEENINDKVATFSILLQRKDGLEISRLKLVVKNYLINATWSNKAIKKDVANLTDNGKNLNIDLKNVETSSQWLGLDKTKTKDNVITAISGSSKNTLEETYKKLIDQETISTEDNSNKYDKFDVSNQSDDNTKTITFTIRMSNSDSSKNVKEEIVKIIVKNHA